MEPTVMYCVLLAIVVVTTAETAATTSHQFSPHNADHSVLNSERPVREGELMMLQDHVKHGDTLLKERLVESSSNLKQLLKEGDVQLKEQLVQGLEQEKEQRQEGDGRLKERLTEDVTWLKEKLSNGESRMKEELAEEKAQMTEKLTDQHAVVESLRLSMKEWKKTRQAGLDQLQQNMSDLQEQVKGYANVLQTTKDQLDLSRTHLTDTQQQLTAQVQASEVLATQLRAAREAIQSLEVKVRSLESAQVEGSSVLDESLDVTAIGSLFTRWGRKTCPVNTSLVYSGVVGGSSHTHSGGASNHLCLVMDPKVDNTTLPSSHTFLYGAEYEHVEGHHDQDVVCSVCRAPQATTLMIPATFTCPQGWKVQYKGQLMTGHHTHKRGTEYVCVDEIRESRNGGLNNDNGDLFYFVATVCGSLPCPPYVNGKPVSCVVCSV